MAMYCPATLDWSIIADVKPGELSQHQAATVAFYAELLQGTDVIAKAYALDIDHGMYDSNYDPDAEYPNATTGSATVHDWRGVTTFNPGDGSPATSLRFSASVERSGAPNHGTVGVAAAAGAEIWFLPDTQFHRGLT